MQYFSHLRKSSTHGAIQSRTGTQITINGKQLVNFANCSYLGLDTDKRAIEGAKRIIDTYGVSFCAARTRLSIEPLFHLEYNLSKLFGGYALTFPSLTTTHVNVLPLLASGIFFEDNSELVIVFDRFAHASMQALIPTIKEHAVVKHIPHNDMAALRSEFTLAQAQRKKMVYVCDSIYSMGGVAPLSDIYDLLQNEDFILYIDDAHGTSIFSDHGEGFILKDLKLAAPKNLFLTFSLSKGFGCNGGGILVNDASIIEKIQTLGGTYQFSGGLDYGAIGAALEVLEIHKSGEIQSYQKTLWRNVSFFDSLISTPYASETSPIRMIHVGDAKKCVALGEMLLNHGFYVPATFFPVVPANEAQLRICISSSHTFQEIESLTKVLQKVLMPFQSQQFLAV